MLLFNDKMGCPKLTYHLTAEPRLRCVYNAADEEENHIVAPTPTICIPSEQPAIWRIYTAESEQPRLYVPEYRLYIIREEIAPGVYRYAYCLNNPLIYTDPSGELAWFVPVIIGAVVGGTAGGFIANNNGGKWWQGAITGAFIGATVGAMFSAAFAPTALGSLNGFHTTGMTTTMANGLTGATKAWGITTNMLNSATMNIAYNAFSGGGWDGAWKAGIVGAVSGGWSATNGLGLLPQGTGGTYLGNLSRRLGYQMIGTTTQSIGNNWAMGQHPLSRVTLGVGPVNLTLGIKDKNGKRPNLLQWQNNFFNIAVNGLGIANLAMGGKMSFNKEHLAFNYYGGALGKLHGMTGMGATGAYATWCETNLANDMETYLHELGHIWQSRSENNFFLLNYFSSYIYDWSDNYYEQLAELFKFSIWVK